MKPLLSSLLFLLAFSLSAQAPTAVPIPQEPHHHLVLENEYVRVFRVNVPSHEATLLHQHDVPYLYVSLGPADVINAVQGKPEAHLIMADGQLGYSPGHFAHIARNDSDLPFNNVTIELLKPQGEPHNWCERVLPTEPTDCSASSHEGARQVSAFRTGEIKVFSETLETRASSKFGAFSDALIVALDDSRVKVSFDKQSQILEAGQVLWIPNHPSHDVRKVIFNNARKGNSRYLSILFEQVTTAGSR
jgi:hypothetical protein